MEFVAIKVNVVTAQTMKIVKIDYGILDYFPDQTSRTKTQSFGETFRILGTAGLWKKRRL